METRLRSPQGKEVVIGDSLPTVLIGERINPFGKGPVKEAMISGDLRVIRDEALRQVEAGADILVVSVAAFGVDEELMLPRVVEEVIRTVDVPFCLESRNRSALEKALGLGCGKPIISSVTGEDALLDQILPLAKGYGAAVVGLSSDGSGPPKDPARRLEIVAHIVQKAEEAGIGREDVLADCVAESNAVNPRAASLTLETMDRVKQAYGLNLILGASNVSFGLPYRSVINAAFLSVAIQRGLTCAIVDAARMKPFAMAADLLLGRDDRARRYTSYCRKLKQVSSP